MEKSKSLFYEYGYCNGLIARKHRINKNVQFILWEAGQQGHKLDYWINFDSSWWGSFSFQNSDTNSANGNNG
jgi:hypothetical protein